MIGLLTAFILAAAPAPTVVHPIKPCPNQPLMLARFDHAEPRVPEAANPNAKTLAKPQDRTSGCPLPLIVRDLAAKPLALDAPSTHA